MLYIDFIEQIHSKTLWYKNGAVETNQVNKGFSFIKVKEIWHKWLWSEQAADPIRGDYCPPLFVEPLFGMEMLLRPASSRICYWSWSAAKGSYIGFEKQREIRQ